MWQWYCSFMVGLALLSVGCRGPGNSKPYQEASAPPGPSKEIQPQRDALSIPGRSALTLRLDLQQLPTGKSIVAVKLENPSSTVADLGPDIIEDDLHQLCQVLVAIHGKLVNPREPVEDTWPYSRLMAVFDPNPRRVIIEPRQSVIVFQQEIDMPPPPEAQEVTICAEMFLPDPESRIRHEGKARGPILTSNTILLRRAK